MLSRRAGLYPVKKEETWNRFYSPLRPSPLSLSAAYGQSMNKDGDTKQTSPGTTGAMGNSSNGGVATDPGSVKTQQGDSSKSSPGTVGAAPGADAPSQKPNP